MAFNSINSDVLVLRQPQWRAMLAQSMLLGLGKLPRKMARPLLRAACAFTKAFVPLGEFTKLKFASDTQFWFPLGDWQASKAYLTRRKYEPELESLFRRIRSVNYSFIDCGANFGYWSVRISGGEFGQKPTLAVEATKFAYDVLSKNSAVNGHRFKCLHRAIFSKSDVQLEIFGVNHTGMTVAPVHGGKREAATGEFVRTTTLDDCVKNFGMDGAVSVVVKLDVEGAEVEAFHGASGLLKKNVLFVFEEEHTDQEHRVASFVANSLGLEIYVLDGSNPPRRLRDIGELGELKRKGVRNLAAAAANSSWSEIMNHQQGWEAN
jgi:FkbM family methyltransferase